ncbi:PAS domain S-box-containing protein/diguanylate cyclase (GGDEF) domain-containing protein [Mariprofundus aestuarium]|uniref:diguanylate cyclase n=1 Tax=Mariprofundus aestuarium TaxID=1921086 RepID=A0A2K8L1K2_MARES|nr:GGDEF domain-containing protein [Mariprofundus aestuarium]ATX78814.1 PAS domain S-box-containing protein/diguanylate cyclase (GGDEF) domain-containing protein [Mariprofundus aestuarium]
MANRSRWFRSSRIIYGIITLLLLIMVASLLMVARAGGDMSKQHVSLIHAIEEIESESSQSHLWLEELLQGDHTVPEEKVLAHLGQAEMLADALLNGGHDYTGTINAVNSPNLQHHIRKIITELQSIRSISEQRIRSSGDNRIGSDIDQKFDATFERLLEEMQLFELELLKLVVNDQWWFTFILNLSILLTVIAMVAIGSLAWKHESQKLHYLHSLKSSEKRLNYLISSTPAVIYSSKASGDFGATFISENVHRLTGYSPSHFIGDSAFWLNHVHPDDRERVTAELSRLFDQDSISYEYRFQNSEGNYLWMQDTAKLNQDKNGEPLEITGSWIDISERKKVEEVMRLQSMITQNIAEGINLVRAGDGILVYANEQFEQMCGYEPGEMVGKNISIVNAPNGKDPEEFAAEVTAALESNGHWSGELQNIRKDGSTFWTYSSVVAFDHGEYGKVYLGAQRDITKRKKIEDELLRAKEKLEKLSYLDGLTSIANRRMLDLMLHREWGRGMREKKPVSLIMIDIDLFKQYNDLHGHIRGDECLKSIAHQLSKVSRRASDICTRYGGEEFALLLPNTDAEQAHRLAESCRQKVIDLNIPHESSTVSEFATISAGVSTAMPSGGLPPASLIEAADAALYRAKNGGRNRVESS